MIWKQQDVSSWQTIANQFQVSSLVAKVLAAKQLDSDVVRDILSEQRLLVNPLQFAGMERFVQRIEQAILNQEKVVVCGDYDADGMCATAIMVDALRKKGLQVGFYIPNRLKEGYGLQSSLVEQFHQKQYTLIVTVDNGIGAIEAAELAKQYNIDLIITDHHHRGTVMPHALVILHPELAEHPRLQSLCGSGVALKCAQALIGIDEYHLALAAIATMADMVPIVYENRVIVQRGLTAIEQHQYPVLVSLASGTMQWTETTLSFRIAPKINATGRLADIANANQTVRMLLQEPNALDLVQQVEQINTIRQQMSAEMLEIAKTLIREDDFVQVIADERFHEGVVGLVAGILVKELGKPCIVCTIEDGMCKGSMRSVDGFALQQVMTPIIPILERFGGHDMAAGIQFPLSKLNEVRESINEAAQALSLSDRVEATIDVIPLEKSDISLSEIRSLRQLAPYGVMNEEPTFLLQNISPTKIISLKENKHLKMTILVQDMSIDCMFFNQGYRRLELESLPTLDLIGRFDIQYFRGKQTVSFHVTDFGRIETVQTSGTLL